MDLLDTCAFGFGTRVKRTQLRRGSNGGMAQCAAHRDIGKFSDPDESSMGPLGIAVPHEVFTLKKDPNAEISSNKATNCVQSQIQVLDKSSYYRQAITTCR